MLLLRMTLSFIPIGYVMLLRLIMKSEPRFSRVRLSRVLTEVGRVMGCNINGLPEESGQNGHFAFGQRQHDTYKLETELDVYVSSGDHHSRL